MKESKREERKKLAEEDALKKIKRLDDSVAELQKALSVQKQEEEALLSEMEVRRNVYLLFYKFSNILAFNKLTSTINLSSVGFYLIF